MLPLLASIDKNLPVCQFPREDYNRIAKILNYLKSGRGITIEREGDRWTIGVNDEWLRGKIEAETSQAIDAAENEAAANAPGVGPATGAVAVILSGTGATANADTWAFGDTDPSTNKLTYPVFSPYRQYWEESTHTLWAFTRTCTNNTDGLLVAVSAETKEAVFVAVPEMP